MKKILTKILIPVMAVVLAVAPVFTSSCSSECEHEVSEWTTVQAATCTHTGLQEGTCTKCLNTVQEVLPIDPDAHVYGDWAVGDANSSGERVAIKTCTECGYYVRANLPALTDINYTATVTQRPSARANGTCVYTYPHELGDISFEVELDKDSAIDTVSAAVSIGANSESHDMIRSVTGTRGDKRVDSGAITSAVLAEVASSAKSFSYEMYDTYTHLIADDSSEYWMGYDGDEIYGYVEDEQGNFNQVSNTNYINGYRYYEVYTDTLSYAYGTENFLSMLYKYAKSNYNGDFTESVVTTASKTTYTFSFGTYTIYSTGTNGALFSKIEVSFTLSSSFTVETFEYYSVNYANDSETYDASTGTWNSDASFNVDENGYAYLVNTNSLKFIETYSVEQTLRKNGETEQTSPYTPDSRFYSDFDVTYNGTAIDTNTSINLPAGSSTGYVFGVENFEPTDTTIYGDTITFYYRTYGTDKDGNITYTDTEINYGTEATVGIFVYYNSTTGKFYLKSNITGDVHLVVKTKKVEKEFVVTFDTTPPTAFYSTVYDYSSYAGYRSETSTDNTATATVYAGQVLYFKASLSSEEAGVKTETYKVTVTGTTTDNKEITSSDYLLTETSSVTVSTGDIESASEFVAYKAGTYTLTLTSTEDSSVTCTITVTVNEMPSMESVLSGTYTATFGDSGNAVTVTFGSITEELTEGIITTYDEEGEAVVTTKEYYICTVIAEIEYDGATNPIVITYYYYTDSDGDDVMFNPTDMMDVVLPDNMLSSIMKIGKGQEEEDVYEAEYIFRIAFNEAYDLVISHSIGDDDASESVILTRPSD